MREATGNLVPVQGEDARPPYPWSPTLMPDGPISLRPTSSTPRPLTDLSACGMSVYPCLSVAVHPLAVVSGLLSVECQSGRQSRTEQQRSSQFGPEDESSIHPHPAHSSLLRTSRQAVGLGCKAACCLLAE